MFNVCMKAFNVVQFDKVLLYSLGVTGNCVILSACYLFYLHILWLHVVQYVSAGYAFSFMLQQLQWNSRRLNALPADTFTIIAQEGKFSLSLSSSAPQ